MTNEEIEAWYKRRRNEICAGCSRLRVSHGPDMKCLNGGERTVVFKSPIQPSMVYTPGTGGWNFEEIKTIYEEATRATKINETQKISCECGAHKIGILDKQFGHSSWCPAKG